MKRRETPGYEGETYSIYVCERHGSVPASKPCADLSDADGYVFVVIGKGLVARN